MIDKERKTPDQIKEEILGELDNGPKSTSEIANNIQSNWITTEKFLSELKEEKKIIELISASKSKIYASLNDLAFFYLPLKEEVRRDTLALLCTIDKIWREESDSSSLSRTKLQKLAVEFVEKNNLQERIPVVRNHYGQTLALRFEGGCTAKQFPLNQDQRNVLIDLIKKYISISSTDARLMQYEKPEMTFYAKKEKLLNDFSKNILKNTESNFLDMLAEYPSELLQSFNLFDSGVYCVINALNLDSKSKYLSNLKEIFSLIWDCLTTEAYFYDIQVKINPEKKELFDQIKSNYLNAKITNVLHVLEELENEINSVEPGPESHNLSESVHKLFNE